ncbi:hypothetical protein W823_04605 [Williamsia sp. D3]|nr:hypothetical protein W823_04605 [Williamsia sp. D3]
MGELDHHVTVCLPSVVTDEILEMLGEGLPVELVLGNHLAVVGGADHQVVGVRGELAAVAEVFQVVFGFALQSVLDLLRGDLAAEDPGEAVIYRTFEFAFDSLQNPHYRRPPFEFSACRRANRAV